MRNLEEDRAQIISRINEADGLTDEEKSLVLRRFETIASSKSLEDAERLTGLTAIKQEEGVIAFVLRRGVKFLFEVSIAGLLKFLVRIEIEHPSAPQDKGDSPNDPQT